MNNVTSDEDGNQETSSVEIPFVNDISDGKENKSPPLSEIPIVNIIGREGRYDSYSADYVYLTNMSGTSPVTLVEEGDVFLGLKAESIVVSYEQYDDGSILYWTALVKFSGEAEIRAGLEYWEYDSQTDFGGWILVTVHEESKHLLPEMIARDEREIFIILMDESDEQFAEIFSGADGYIIEDCRIVISDYRIVYFFTDAFDDASFVEIKQDKKVRAVLLSKIL
jgi:hypothetical protein